MSADPPPDTVHGPPEQISQIGKQFETRAGKAWSEGVLPELVKPVEYQMGSGGKRLRPAFCLWLGRHLGATDDELFPFALAVELLHNALLVHDDIEDGDRYRRGLKTLWCSRGVPEALNVGDYLFARALRSIARSPVEAAVRVDLYELFAEVFELTVEGQALDLAGRADPSFTLANYDAVIRRKTGRYLVLGWVAAARIAGRTRREAEELWAVGDELGPAFQIRDDLLDLTPGKGRGGQIGCDIREGKPSILFAKCLETDLPRSDREQLLETMGRPRSQTTDDQVTWVIDLFAHSGAIAHAEAECGARLAAGIRTFESLPWIPEVAKANFSTLAEYLIARKV